MFETCARKERRYKLLKVSPELLLQAVLRPDRFPHGVTVEGLPNGVSVDGVSWDEWRRIFIFRLWHQEWPEVRPGDKFDDLDITIKADEEVDNPVYK